MLICIFGTMWAGGETDNHGKTVTHPKFSLQKQKGNSKRQKADRCSDENFRNILLS